MHLESVKFRRKVVILYANDTFYYSGDNYFNALRRLDFKMLKLKMREEEFHEFLCTHLVAATREVRPDIVRLLFQQVTFDLMFVKTRLQRIVAFKIFDFN